MNKKQLYVAPAMEVSEFKVCNLILSSIGGNSGDGGNTGDGGSTVEGSNNGVGGTAGRDESSIAKQMTTVFTTD